MFWRLFFLVFISGLIYSLGFQDEYEYWTVSEKSAFCTTCSVGMNTIIKADNATIVSELLIQLCIDLGIGSEAVCEGNINLNEPAVLYILENSPNITGSDVCSIIFVGYGCTSDNPSRIWEVQLPNTTKPPVDEPPLAGVEKPTLKVLHLADTHFDPIYLPGADTSNCLEKYLCCREINGIPTDPNNGAGFWGDYRNCDAPKWTLEALYEHMALEYPDIDFIIWTGDLVPHDAWDSTPEINVGIINEMADLVSQYFPSIPVFPAVGNHEASPANLFPPPYVTDPELEISWLYEELNRVWQRWLPEDVATNVTYGAFYSTHVKPGLRIISVNTNYGYSQNFWLVMDSTDIANELELLAKELQDAEDKGDYAYIIGHMPSGESDCSLTWSHEFNKVVSRYESTISGIFFGHTHLDHFELFFDPSNSSRIYEVGYIAPSQTTHTKINPGYKVYTIEGDFSGSRYRVINHENWAIDLDTSNSLNETVFMKLYSALEDYNLPDLSPQSWLNFVYEMNQPNSTLFDEFFRNYVKAGTASLEKGCDDGCKSNILCKLLISDNSDHSHCDILLNSL